jgi:hypothetical protein
MKRKKVKASRSRCKSCGKVKSFEIMIGKTFEQIKKAA